MTHNRKFKEQVRKLAELNNLSYTDALKQWNSIQNVSEPESQVNEYIELGMVASTGSGKQETFFWNFKKQAHMLLKSKIGNGATSFVSNLIKNAESYGFEIEEPNIHEYEAPYEATLGFVNHINDQLSQRLDAMQAKGIIDFSDTDYSRKLIILDELAVDYEEPKPLLVNLLLKGRAAGIHCILRTRHDNPIDAYLLNCAVYCDFDSGSLRAGPGIADVSIRDFTNISINFANET